MPGSEAVQLKGLAFKAAIAALLAAAVGAGLEYEARRAPTSFRQKRMGLEAAAPSAQVLVLGPSVALNGVDPSQWSVPGYNLANNGQSLYYDRALLERWVPRMPALRLVLIGIARPSLRATVVSMHEGARGFAYRREFGIAHEDPAQRADPRNWSAALALEPWKVLVWAWSGRGLVLGDVSNFGLEALPALDPEQQELQLGGLVAQKHAALQRAMMVEPMQSGLDQVGAMLALCRSRGLAAAVVVPPVTPAFAGESEDGRAEEMAALRALCRSQGAGFRDYFRDPRFRDPDFADVDHLAAPAAARFSRILEKDFLTWGAPKTGASPR